MIDSETIKIFTYFFVENDKQRVLYGCGKNGIILLNWLKKYMPEVKFDKYVDGSKSVQSTGFLNKFIVEDPSVISGGVEDYKIMVTPQHPEEICDILKEYGYRENESFITMDIIETVSYGVLFQYLKETNYNFRCVLSPNLYELPCPTEVEQCLKSMTNIFDNKYRMEWFRSAPPHIYGSHKDLAYYSSDYIKNIFTPLEAYERDGIMYHRDYKSTYVNCTGGIRVTTDQPDKYENCIYMFGPSYIYGFGVEDKYTIPSCFQRLLNDDGKNILVLNYGIRGIRPEQYLSQIQNAQIKEKDILILYMANSQRAKEFLMLNQIPYIDMNSFFLKSRSYEMFFDRGSHLNYKGNLYIARCIYKMMYGGTKQLENVESNVVYKIIDAACDNETVQNIDFYGETESIYKSQLSHELLKLKEQKVKMVSNASIGSIVMNCNPFTLGHYHLIRIAAQIVDLLYVFVVEEDRSEFPFLDRIELVRKGVAELENVKVLSSGKYMISSLTFPEYFDKEEKQLLNLDLSEDVSIFGKYIAPMLDIRIRFVGEEYTDIVTRQYNETLKRILPKFGIKVLEIPRLKYNGNYISASIVRKMFHEGKLDELEGYIPDITYDYLKKKSCVSK